MTAFIDAHPPTLCRSCNAPMEYGPLTFGGEGRKYPASWWCPECDVYEEVETYDGIDYVGDGE